MKIIQIMLFLVILNGVFTILNVAEIYPTTARMGVDQRYANETDFTNTSAFTILLGDLGFAGFITGSAMLVALGLAVATGTNIFTSLSFGVMAGLVVATIRKLFIIFSNIVTATGPEARPIFIAIVAIFTVVVVFLFVWGLIQMATGGGRGHE